MADLSTAATLLPSKPALASTGVWGSLFAIIAGLSTAYTAYKAGDTNTALTAGVATLGGAAALYGRVKATAPYQRLGFQG